MNERTREIARNVIVCVAIACIPLIYAGLLVWSNVDPTHNLSSIPAAIVNEDRPAEAANGSVQQLGVDLADELLENDESTNFAWSEMDATTAASALESGEVLAVLSIPEDFSEAAVSAGSEDVADAVQAKLTITTNDGANLIIGNIAGIVGQAITEALRTQVSEAYLEQVYLGFTDIHSSISEAADGASELAGGAATASNGSGELVVGLQQLALGTGELSSGASTLASGVSSAADGAATVADGSKKVSTGSSALASSLGDLATGMTRIADGTDSALSGAQQLQTGAGAAVAGATAIDDGLDQLIANYDLMTDEQRLAALQRLAAGTTSLVGDDESGLTLLANGTTALVGDDDGGLTLLALSGRTAATGAQTAATKSGELAAGASQVADGAGQLAVGVSQAATGSASLADGAQTVASGAGSASSGAAELDSGLGELSAGADELATGLGDGVAEIPNYTDSEASSLASVSSDPIGLEQERMNEVPEYGYGLAPYFMALSLWVGALAFYMMMPALRDRLVHGRGNAALVALRSLAPGALMAVAQSILMVSIVRFGVDIELVNLPGALGLALLTSLTFFAINQALIALLGAPGRFLALILMVFQLASAGGTYPIQTAPELFQTLNSWLPLTYPVEAFRAMIAGGSIGVDAAIRVLVCWLLGALIVTVLAVVVRRRLAPAAPAPAPALA